MSLKILFLLTRKHLQIKLNVLATMEYYLVKTFSMKILIDFYIGLIHYQPLLFLESQNYFLIKQGASKTTLFIGAKYIEDKICHFNHF